MAAVSPLHSSGNFLLYTVDNVFGVVIGRELGVEDIDAVERHSLALVDQTGARGHCVYIYYAAGLAIPARRTRARAASRARMRA